MDSFTSPVVVDHVPRLFWQFQGLLYSCSDEEAKLCKCSIRHEMK
jgi:hypothetical protein